MFQASYCRPIIQWCFQVSSSVLGMFGTFFIFRRRKHRGIPTKKNIFQLRLRASPMRAAITKGNRGEKLQNNYEHLPIL